VPRQSESVPGPPMHPLGFYRSPLSSDGPDWGRGASALGNTPGAVQSSSLRPRRWRMLLIVP
jgi:hypothetical protein